MGQVTGGHVAWSGEAAHAAALAKELARISSAIRSGHASSKEGHQGLGPNHEVSIRQGPHPRARSWIVRLREGSTTIQAAHDPARCYVSIDQIAGTCGYHAADEKACISSALAHVDLALHLVSCSGGWMRDDDVEDRIERVAVELAVHALAKHGPAREAHAMIYADGPFYLGRASGMVSMIQTNPGSAPPKITSAFLRHLENIVGRAAKVSVEGAGLALIGPLCSPAIAICDPMKLLREHAEGSSRSLWTS